MSGAFTVSDEHMMSWQKKVMDLEKIRLELSACAGFAGVMDIERAGSAWEEYLRAHELTDYMDQATHIVWGTGGGLMPAED
jgi:D-serine dehydratase